MYPMFRRMIWFPALLLLAAGMATAQTGAIEGDVKGEDGKMVP